jgi:predicted ATPase
MSTLEQRVSDLENEVRLLKSGITGQLSLLSLNLTELLSAFRDFSRLLTEHTRILDGHSETLAQLLEGQDRLETGQAEILRRLPPAS